MRARAPGNTGGEEERERRKEKKKKIQFERRAEMAGPARNDRLGRQ